MHVLCNMKTMVVFNTLTRMRAFPRFFPFLFFSVIVIVSFQMFVYDKMYPHDDGTRARAPPARCITILIFVYRHCRYPNKT